MGVDQNIPNELLQIFIPDVMGKIKRCDDPCPNTYFVSAERQKPTLLKDYYAVLETAEIFPKVRAYGQAFPGLRLYDLDVPDGGWQIVKYEASKYRVRHGLPLQGSDSLHSIAISAAEDHPEYFGAYPAPIDTPRGFTLRYRTLSNGIYLAETSMCEEVLAVSYPVWNAELSETVQRMGEQTIYDQMNGIHNTLGYLFFSQTTMSAAIYELLETHPSWTGTLIDPSALMNAIWKDIPHYAVLANWWEQTGCICFRTFWARFSDMDASTAESLLIPNRTVSIFPEAGDKYLLWE